MLICCECGHLQMLILPKCENISPINQSASIICNQRCVCVCLLSVCYICHLRSVLFVVAINVHAGILGLVHLELTL